MAIENQTREQEAEFRRLHHVIATNFGLEAAESLCKDINDWRERHDMDWRSAYYYAIQKAKEKLNAPVLDDVEYHEIMRAQEIMEGT